MFLTEREIKGSGYIHTGTGLCLVSILLKSEKPFGGPFKDLTNGYATDLLYPLGHYFGMKGILTSYTKLSDVATSVGATLFSFGGCAALEVAQKYGHFPGTYDPMDFLAYGIGTGIALGIDLVKNPPQINHVSKITSLNISRT